MAPIQARTPSRTVASKAVERESPMWASSSQGKVALEEGALAGRPARGEHLPAARIAVWSAPSAGGALSIPVTEHTSTAPANQGSGAATL